MFESWISCSIHLRNISSRWKIVKEFRNRCVWINLHIYEYISYAISDTVLYLVQDSSYIGKHVYVFCLFYIKCYNHALFFTYVNKNVSLI